MEGIKHALLSTGPAYLVSLVFLSIYGLRFGGGTVGGETYEAILSTVTSQFNLSPLLLLPPIVVVVLIVLKKPTLPTFTAGIFVAVVLAWRSRERMCTRWPPPCTAALSATPAWRWWTAC